MDWKETLRQRLATPSSDPKSEFGRGRPLSFPSLQNLQVVKEERGVVPADAFTTSVNPPQTKEVEGFGGSGVRGPRRGLVLSLRGRE